jgi:protein-tyrosine phosphatase
MEVARRLWQRLIARVQPHGVLFVCAANVCRSPMAEQVMRSSLVRIVGARRARGLRLRIASAGTHVARRAEPPDTRALEALRRRGHGTPGRSMSRALSIADFDHFDLLLAMDDEVLAAMHALAPSNQLHKVRRVLDHAPGLEGQDVPDPYWGDQRGFEHVLDLLEAAAPGVIAAIEERIEAKRRATEL